MCLFISKSYANKWDYVATAADNNSDYYLDLKSIETSNGYIRYFVLVDYKKKLEGAASSAIVYLEGPCYLYEIKVLTDRYYSNNMSKGQIVGGSDIPDENMTKFPKDSAFGFVLNKACALID